MKVVGGTEVITKTLVGAKYIANDGKEFSNQFDCEQYEAFCKEKAKEKCLEKAVNSITKEPIDINALKSNDYDLTYIKRFETEGEFKDIIKTLNCYTSGVDHSTYIDNYTLDYATLPAFPATFLIKRTYINYDDMSESEIFDFYNASKYIETLKQDISTIEDALSGVKNDRD